MVIFIKTALSYAPNLASENLPDFVAYLIGTMLAQGIIIAAFWSITWSLTRMRKVNGPLIFSIVYIAIALIMFTSYFSNAGLAHRQENLALQKIVQMTENVQNGIPIEDEEFSPENTPESAQILNMTKEMYDNINKASSDFKTAVDNSYLEKILAEETLMDEQEITDARDRLGVLVEKINESEDLRSDSIANFIEHVKESKLPETYKAGLINGFFGFR